MAPNTSGKLARLTLVLVLNMPKNASTSSAAEVCHSPHRDEYTVSVHFVHEVWFKTINDFILIYLVLNFWISFIQYILIKTNENFHFGLYLNIIFLLKSTIFYFFSCIIFPVKKSWRI